MHIRDGPANVTHVSMRHESPESKLHDGDLQRLHSANDVAINWLEETAMKALIREAGSQSLQQQQQQQRVTELST